MSEWENSNGGSDEYYTPPEVFAALSCVFDLDVASPGRELCYTPAKRHLTENSLEVGWEGRVWCNPPFGKRNGVVPWLKKFIAHGNGLGLVRAYTSAGWFHDLIPEMDAILFPKGKTKFIREDQTVAKSPGHGIVLFAKGDYCVHKLGASRLGMFFLLDGSNG